MSAEKIKIGTRFEKLVTISEQFTDGKNTKILCRCDCGTEKPILRQHLVKKSGATQSCGCLRKIINSSRKKYKADLKHPLHESFRSMHRQCYEISHKKYLGGQIKVCQEWLNNYDSFYDWAIQYWQLGLFLTRTDKSKDYNQENCLFINRSQINSNDLAKEKHKQTCLKKYGVEYYRQTQECKDRLKATYLDKYGVDSWNKVPELKDKRVKTLLEKYGRIFPVSSKVSKTELLIKAMVEDWTKKQFESTYKVLGGKQLDMYNQELKFAIEFCGIAWHNELRGRPRPYHYSKYKKCKDLGIRLITIFSDEWINRQSQVKNYLKASLDCCSRRYFARKCEVREIDKVIGQKFVEDYHIQGQKRVAAVYFGIFNSDELLGVLSLNLHHRTGKDLVLDRLCFKDDVAIAGGSSRLFSLAIKWAKQNNYTKIVSWSDNRWSYGNVYEKLGFTREKDMKPDYSYVDMQSIHKRISKQSMQKKHIGCPEDVTERDFLFEKKIYRIWDCGKIRWVYNII